MELSEKTRQEICGRVQEEYQAIGVPGIDISGYLKSDVFFPVSVYTYMLAAPILEHTLPVNRAELPARQAAAVSCMLIVADINFRSIGCPPSMPNWAPDAIVVSGYHTFINQQGKGRVTAWVGDRALEVLGWDE